MYKILFFIIKLAIILPFEVHLQNIRIVINITVGFIPYRTYFMSSYTLNNPHQKTLYIVVKKNFIQYV